jgi:hypothetical protein
LPDIEIVDKNAGRPTAVVDPNFTVAAKFPKK